MNALLLSALTSSSTPIPLTWGGQVSCGFPSPATDYQQPDLSLDALVGLHPASSIFLLEAWGDSMREAGIFSGDILIVDKAREAQTEDVVVAVIGAEFLVKRLGKDADGWPALLAENPKYAPIRMSEEEPVEVWGVVLWVMHRLARR